ncbi:cytochrome c family protein [Allostella sp. ATCC 35155]|nr:cytochrome c family protein [Stella sp. ATCC 35155]
MRETARLAMAGLIMIWAGPAAADGDADTGAAFARKHCAACHAIRGDGASPNPSAPPFRGITKDWPADSVAEALAEGIRIGHEGKPMVALDLTVEEVADLVAYIAAVQR